MGKIWIEVCLISARGVRRTSSLWKLQWFSVGWIDPGNKYCTKIDASGNPNPSWKTKFSTLVDTTSESNFQDLALHVEVYCREPIFLGKKLMGTATVALKEFLDKFMKSSQVMKPVEEVGSFQLRAKRSNKPQGFVDVSIRISAEKEEPCSYPGDHEGFELDNREGITLPSHYGPPQAYAPQVPFPTTYSHPSVAGPSHTPSTGGSSYQPPQTPPLPPPRPPPPANVGYIPTSLPRTDNYRPSYVNMPSSSSGTAAGRAYGPGFGMGVGGGALAAGGVIYGDDFMTGFDFPGGLQDDSLRISIDPPF